MLQKSGDVSVETLLTLFLLGAMHNSENIGFTANQVCSTVVNMKLILFVCVYVVYVINNAIEEEKQQMYEKGFKRNNVCVCMCV